MQPFLDALSCRQTSVSAVESVSAQDLAGLTGAKSGLSDHCEVFLLLLPLQPDDAGDLLGGPSGMLGMQFVVSQLVELKIFLTGPLADFL